MPFGISKPALLIFSLKYLAFDINLFFRSLFDERVSITLIDAPTIDGAKVFEKRYGLDLCLNI